MVSSEVKKIAAASGRGVDLDSLLITYLPNVNYLTGFTGSSGCVLLTPRQRLFFTDFRYRSQATQEVKGFKIRIVSGAAFEGALAYAAKKRLKLGVTGYEASHISHRQYLQARRLLKGVKLVDATGMVEAKRRVKSRSELRKIRRACRIADEALYHLVRIKVTGKTEKQVAWFLESLIREAGSGPLPFDIIVASGPRAAMPHGVASDRIIKKGELVVVDLGASVAGYCSDITRTFATGKPSRVLTNVYQVVKKAQELAVAAVKPGADCAALDKIAREHIAAAGYEKEFGHSLGHGVGLEPHEGPLLAARSKEKLQAGMTVTVEPGIYLDGVGGVRIEDTVLVGKRGPVPLTMFPRELKVLR